MTINVAMLSNAKALNWTYGLYCTLYMLYLPHTLRMLFMMYILHTLQSLPAGFVWLPAASMAVLYLIMTYMKGAACRQHKLWFKLCEWHYICTKICLLTVTPGALPQLCI